MKVDSRFYDQEGRLDPELVELWAEGFCQDLLNIINGFYARVEMDEVLQRMQDMPFQRMAAEQLEGLSDEVIVLALDLVGTIAAREIEYLQAYRGKL
jgi:hypothetical protein